MRSPTILGVMKKLSKNCPTPNTAQTINKPCHEPYCKSAAIVASKRPVNAPKYGINTKIPAIIPMAKPESKPTSIKPKP
ncbi:Uncharacterised protein [Mycobacteroides abscessus subsp. massiliense]|nr:Uncharacterised protein [Mycobacteroides abscessus subsp. massiliense]